jgi:transcriptional regulator with XRE-family HTH domain
LGISQEELAERADMHRTYVTGIELGARNPTLKSIDKLAKALGVPTAALLSSTGKTASQPKSIAIGTVGWKTRGHPDGRRRSK